MTGEVTMIDLHKIAARLDNEEKLRLKYRAPAAADRKSDYTIRTDRLLDVAEDFGVLYVDRDGDPVWVRIEEAIEVLGNSEDDA